MNFSLLFHHLRLFRFINLFSSVLIFSCSSAILNLVNAHGDLDGMETEMKAPVPPIVTFGITVFRLAHSKKTRPETWHKMRLVYVFFNFENNAVPTDLRTGRGTDGPYRDATAHLTS